MRVSLTARYVSHPTIEFTARRARGRRPRLGLGRSATVFHRPRAVRRAAPTVASLRSLTSGFTFPSVARPGRIRGRRAVLTLDSPRVRRA